MVSLSSTRFALVAAGLLYLCGLSYGISALKTTRWKTGGGEKKYVSISKIETKTPEGSLLVKFRDVPKDISLRSGKVKLGESRLGWLFSFCFKTAGEASQTDIKLTCGFFDSRNIKIPLLRGKNRGKDKKGRWYYRVGGKMAPLIFEETPEGDWTRRAYWIPVLRPRKDPNRRETHDRADKIQFFLRVGGATGSFFLDDFKFSPLPDSFGKKPDRLFWTAAYRRGVGETPSNRLRELQAANSPFLKSAQRYHECLALYARAVDRYEHLRRAAYYADPSSRVPFENRLKTATQKLDALYRTYGRLYLEDRPRELLKLNTNLKEFFAALNKLYKEMGEKLLRRMEAAGVKDAKLVSGGPSATVEISPDGRFNHFGIHSWAKEYHLDALKPFANLYQIVFPRTGGGYAKTFVAADGSVDVGEYLEGIKHIMTKGGKYFIIPTAFASGIGSEAVVRKSFYKKHSEEKEFIFQSNLGGKPRISPSKGMARTYVNIFDSEIREETLRTAGFVAASTGKLPVIPVICWEDNGPYFPEIIDGKTTLVIAGYSRQARERFREHLKKKFGTIQRLNRELGTSFGSFGDIRQPGIKLRNIPRPHPLATVFLKWVHEYLLAYRVDLYKTIKSARPDIPVMADHSRMFTNTGFNPVKLFDSCDIIAVHNRHRGRLGQTVLYSMTRYKPKTLGCFEEHGHGELSQSGEREKAALKNVVLGRFLNTGHSMYNMGQSYSTGPHSVSWGSNYWANPTYDCTILRYHTTMIPVALDRIGRLEAVFKSTMPIPPRTAMMIPESSMYLQKPGGPSAKEMLETFNLLYPNGCRFEFETEEMLTDGTASLRPYKYLIMPMAAFFPRGLWERIIPWVKTGGTLVAIGPCGRFDAYGFDAKEGLTYKLEGKTPFPEGGYNDCISWDWGERSSLRTHKMGKGKYIAVPRPIASVANDAGLLKAFLEIFNPADQKVFAPDTRVELTLRRERDGEEITVFALNPHPCRRANGTIRVEGKFARCLDLDMACGFPIKCAYDAETDYSAFRFALAPGAWTLYRLKPD